MYYCIEPDRMKNLFREIQKAELALAKGNAEDAENAVSYVRVMLETEIQFGQVPVSTDLTHSNWQKPGVLKAA